MVTTETTILNLCGKFQSWPHATTVTTIWYCLRCRLSRYHWIQYGVVVETSFWCVACHNVKNVARPTLEKFYSDWFYICIMTMTVHFLNCMIKITLLSNNYLINIWSSIFEWWKYYWNFKLTLSFRITGSFFKLKLTYWSNYYFKFIF